MTRRLKTRVLATASELPLDSSLVCTESRKLKSEWRCLRKHGKAGLYQHVTNWEKERNMLVDLLLGVYESWESVSILFHS